VSFKVFSGEINSDNTVNTGSCILYKRSSSRFSFELLHVRK